MVRSSRGEIPQREEQVHMKNLVLACAAIAVAGVAGCKKKEPPKPVPVAQPTPPGNVPTASPTQPAQPTQPTPPTAPPSGQYQGQDSVANGGTITGKVTWKGGKPTLEPFPITKDNAICGKEKPSNRLVVGAGDSVQYAVVSIANITSGKKIMAGANPTLDQANCEYAPHVQVVPVDSTLTVINSDTILHNVHAYLGSATEFNMGMPLKGQKIPKPMKKAGLVELKCDAGHVWMNAYIVVAEHPYHAV